MLLVLLNFPVGSLLSTTALAVACRFSGGCWCPLPTLLLKSNSTGFSSLLKEVDDAGSDLLLLATLMSISLRPPVLDSLSGTIVVVVVVMVLGWIVAVSCGAFDISESVKTFVLLGLGIFEGDPGALRGDACFRGDLTGVRADEGVLVASAGSGKPLNFATIDSWFSVRGS